jgi:preprotein translocase subunit SecB
MADPQQQGDGAQGPAFSIDKIYLKDLSLESPGAPQSFLNQEQPQIEVGLRTRGEQIQTDVYECVLTVTLTAKVADKTLFLVEASQAGLFTIRGVPPEHLQPIIAINCPTVLFPYVRETVADAVTRAGFPPIHLSPINFDMLYQQQLAQMTQQVPAAAAVN